MAFTVQNDTGTQAGANAYITVAEFKSYHDDRGNDYGSASDTVIQAAIIRATDYLDSRFNFRGEVLEDDQTTRWPREACPGIDLVTPDGVEIEGVPRAVKYATAEYAFRALSNPLYQDAPAPDGGRPIESYEVQVDTIREATRYFPSSSEGGFVMPAYPAADMMLARSGLIETGRTLTR